MYKTLKTKLQSLKLGPHWGTLLAADSVITVFTGLFAYSFNHGTSASLSDFVPLLCLLLINMLCYMAGFVLLQTYNSFENMLPYRSSLRSTAALIFGASLTVVLRLTLPDRYLTVPFGYGDLMLQMVFSFMVMGCLRALVRIHYDFYVRRSDSSGAYGLSDIALLNMEMSELLQRKPISVNTDAIGSEMRGKRIMITGAGGSIGSELVRQLLGYEPASLVLIDQSESPLHEVRMMLERSGCNAEYKAVVTDICHSHRMEHIFDRFRPEIIFHAAAYKHVPMMEDNPVESVLNNIDGTRKLADLAVKFGVDKFVMISTDKAVNPTNIMGCSKRICEIYCQSLSHDEHRRGSCQFITTRFGNVLGSNGSVVPIFREQIRRGGPVQVTHPDIIRYFMLIPEACQLVLEAATIGHGGEIFAFDMGEPVRIADLAKKMIKISGRKDIKIEYTGLRNGEKLYEEVLTADETVLPTSHDKIKIAKVREYDFDSVAVRIDELVAVARTYDAEATVRLMSGLVPEYNPVKHNA